MGKSSLPNNPHKDPRFWVMWVIIIVLLTIGGIHKCKAATKDEVRYDTIPARVECIVKFVEKTSVNSKGNKTTRYYVVYKDSQIGINDIIPMSESVHNYIIECNEFEVSPQLGIKLKNGEVYSIIRIRKKLKPCQ